jgi:hypothetical protein
MPPILTVLLGLSAPTLASTPITVAFSPPDGAERVDADAFGTWLRTRTVAAPDRPVKTHDGRVVPGRQRVIELPVVRGDLQQCADSAIRMRAEWQKATGQPVLFHATSGDPMAWDRWAKGDRPHEEKNTLVWTTGHGAGTWDGYLQKVFMWAGTRSLHAYDTVPADGSPQPGDVLVDPGSPGHAVLLMDVATKGDATYVLVGEGFMPAQDFHVELGDHDGWWRWDDGIPTYHWPLPAASLRRWAR